jgi:hypothetical protein
VIVTIKAQMAKDALSYLRCQAMISGTGSRPSCRPAGGTATYGTPAATPPTAAFWSLTYSSRSASSIVFWAAIIDATAWPSSG